MDTVRAGWLIKDDGIWTLTEEGAKALKRYRDPLEFHKKAAHLYQQWYRHHRGFNIPRLSDQAWQRLPLTPIYVLTPEK